MARLRQHVAPGSWRGRRPLDAGDRVADALVWDAFVGLLPSFLGDPPRSQGALIRFDDQSVASVPVHAVYHPSQRDDPRLAILIEEISRQLDRVL